MMLKDQAKARIQILCSRCGSTDVSRDAWTKWDVAAQEWMLRAVYDHAYCHACDNETRLAEAPLA